MGGVIDGSSGPGMRFCEDSCGFSTAFLEHMMPEHGHLGFAEVGILAFGRSCILLLP